ncbi:hypothetical protein AV530_014991 [Patagioenas fasciata monilis]|uniref:Uncharacterized protein n=1 Tax=Patagioenas fasciata monilis TaxID=372326 RepID=A0A1V4K0J0_PATFA|nr:hypothetical protein AV530_014991 [Patagioenas fasciata monilis]
MIKKRWRQIDYSKCRATGTLKTLIQFVSPGDHPTQLYKKEMSTKDFSKSGRVSYYRQTMVLSEEDAINKTDLNSFPQGLIAVTMEAGMAKTFQNGP